MSPAHLKICALKQNEFYSRNLSNVLQMVIKKRVKCVSLLHSTDILPEK
jgi:hypothetical protein